MNKQGVRNALEEKHHRRQNTMTRKPSKKILNVTNNQSNASQNFEVFPTI